MPRVFCGRGVFYGINASAVRVIRGRRDSPGLSIPVLSLPYHFGREGEISCGSWLWKDLLNCQTTNLPHSCQYRSLDALGDYTKCVGGAIRVLPFSPRFPSLAFLTGRQVKLWWARPRLDTGLAASPVRTRPATAPPSPSVNSILADYGPTKNSASSPTQRRPSTAADVVGSRLVVGGEASREAPPPDQRTCAFFTLDVLQPKADGVGTAARSIHSGPELWTDLTRSAPSCSASSIDVSPTLVPASAYCVRLSTKTTTAQPETAVETVIVTAPPAPVLEPATTEGKETSPEATAGEELGVVGAVTLKAVWNTGIDTSFLPVGVEPPPVSFALEMAHAREAGLPTHGAGGTATKVARNMASDQNSPPGISFPSPRGATAAGSSPSTNAARSPGGTREIPVRQDAGSGRCWTLSSSSWGKPKTRAEGFRVVWAGEEARATGGVMEALTPPLPPGMRFVFRVRTECRFGVAVSAATVYQTAAVAPMPPKVRWLGEEMLTVHATVRSCGCQ